jgi:nucleotidyltransferase substrate binding protein (TIGR01987 family)
MVVATSRKMDFRMGERGERMPLQLDSFRNALAALRAVQARSEDTAFMAGMDAVTREAIRFGVIQHFEFTFELAWKFMRRQLEADIGRASVDGIPRRDLFRIAAENGLIDDVEVWFRYHLARNQTSHTYDPPIAASVYACSLAFAPDAAALLAALEARNA